MRPLNQAVPDWAVQGSQGRERRMLSSIYLKAEDEEVTNIRLLERWQTIEANEVRFKEYYLEDAEIAVVGFGTAGRVAFSAVRAARAQGIPVGLLRPITLSPFPSKRIAQLASRVRALLVVEMNTGQMLPDVQLAVAGRIPVEFYGRLGGVVPFQDEILTEIQRLATLPFSPNGDPRRSWLKRLKANNEKQIGESTAW
jgi:2-oxoglutarate ferredoxin oxidoreductase subunit alpha